MKKVEARVKSTRDTSLEGAQPSGEPGKATVVPLAEKPAKGKTFKDKLNEAFDRYFPVGRAGAKDALKREVMDLAETAAQAAFHTGLNRGMQEGREQTMRELEAQVNKIEGEDGP